MNTLPNTYQQVKYIESTGTQYIDTGINADSKLQTIIDMQYTDISNYNNTNFGAIKAEPSIIRYHIMVRYSTWSVWLNSTENAFPNISADLNRHLFNLDVPNGKLTLDNNEISFTLETFDTELNFWLFARNSDLQSAIYYNKSKIYRCKMIYNGTIVRDFVPCYRKSDNTIGLYDVINNVFYTNNGTGTFIKGNNVTIADKLSYLRETKNQIKDRINFLTGEITDETTFRDYTVALDNLYNELPKTNTIESDFVQIKETRKGKLLLTPKGNVEQETTKGKNILNVNATGNTSSGITKVIDNQTITVNGTTTVGQSFYITNDNIVVPAGNYTVSIKEISGSATLLLPDTNQDYIFIVSFGSSIDAKIKPNQKSVTVNLPSDYTGKPYIWFGHPAAGATASFDNYKFNIQIESGSTATEYEPYTGGTPSPNPDYPQDVKVVTGENNIIVGGLNLLDNTKFDKVNPSQSVTPTFKDGKVIINGAAGSGGSDIRISSTTPFLTLKAGTYTFLFNEASTDWNCELNLTTLHLGTYQLVKRRAENKRLYAITFDSDFEIYNLNIHLSPNVEFVNREFWLMILEGAYTIENAPNFEPYIEPIEKELNLIGKNKFNSNTITENTYIQESGNTGSSSATNLSDYILVKSSTNYELTFDFTTLLNSNVRSYCYYDVNKNYISGASYNPSNKTATFSVPNNARYIRFGYDKNCYNIQLEEGTATEYEPYYNYELAKIGTNSDLIFKNEITNPYYDNTLIENAWYKKELIGKRILNGTETWGKSGDIYYCSSISDYTRNTNIPYSNYFIGDINKSSAGDTFIDNSIAFNKSTQNNRLYIRADSIGSMTSMTAWLAEHNTTVYYLKDNPTNIQITETDIINQLEELNKVIGTGGTVTIHTESESNNAPLIISASALAPFEN